MPLSWHLYKVPCAMCHFLTALWVSMANTLFPALCRPSLFFILSLFTQYVKRFSAFCLLAFSVLFNYPYMFLLLVVVVGNVELWNCLCIPLFSLCLWLLFMCITLWINCGFAVDNFRVVVSRSFVVVLARSRLRSKKRVFCDGSLQRGC